MGLGTRGLSKWTKYALERHAEIVLSFLALRVGDEEHFPEIPKVEMGESI